MLTRYKVQFNTQHRLNVYIGDCKEGLSRDKQLCMLISGGTSNRKVELSVAGESDPSTRVQKLIARKLRAHEILIATHVPDACVA